MKRVVFSALLTAFALAGFAGSAPAQSTSNVTGDWVVQVTGDQFIVGTLHLTQVGQTVVGSALPGKGSGVLQISGTLTGQKLSGKWRAPKGGTGWLTLNFNASGSAFSGEWGYNGRPPNGKLVSRQFTATAF